jgi:outer membrane protein
MRPHRLALTLAAALFACDAGAVNLLQVYQEALANDPVYASARAQLQAGHERLPQGRAGLLPSVGVNGSWTRQDTDATLSALPGDVNASAGANVNTYTVSLAQPLFRWANWEQYQQGRLAVAASEAQFEQARHRLISMC